MDKLADALDIDPIELRPAERARARRLAADRADDHRHRCPSPEVIRRAAALDVPEPEELPRDPMRLPGGAGNTTRGEGVKRGVGFAVGFKNIGYSEGFDDYCAARVQLHADGSATVHCAAAEVGPGRRERHPPGRAHRARHPTTSCLRRTRLRPSTPPAPRRLRA